MYIRLIVITITITSMVTATNGFVTLRISGDDEFLQRNDKFADILSFPRSARQLQYQQQQQQQQQQEQPFVCLYIPPSLPSCDFEKFRRFEQDYDEKTETLGRKRENRRFFEIQRNVDEEEEEKEEEEEVEEEQRVEEADNFENDKTDFERPHRRVETIVYKLEGCLPSRLPFKMPFCDGNSVTEVVEVRSLFPFPDTRRNATTKAPFVFPKFNMKRWLRLMKRLRNQREASSSMTSHETHNDEDENDENHLLLSKRRNPFERRETLSKSKERIFGSNFPKSHKYSSFSRNPEEEDGFILVEFRMSPEEENDENRDLRNTFYDFLYPEEKEEIEESDVDEDEESRYKVPRQSKLEKKKRGKKWSPRKLKSAQEAIPTDPKRKSASLKAKKKRRVIRSDYQLQNLITVEEGSEFPYSKAIPFDPNKLRPVSVRSELHRFSSDRDSNSRKFRSVLH